MKPTRARDKLQKAGTSRAKMFLKADLWWLRGFPLDEKKGRILWLSIPQKVSREPEKVLLTGEHIRKAKYTYNKLTRRFPRAMPQVIDNYIHWKRMVPILLESLNKAIHKNRGLPRDIIGINNRISVQLTNRANKLINRYHCLRPFVRSLAWLALLSQDEFESFLNVLEDSQKYFTDFLKFEKGHDKLLVALTIAELICHHGKTRSTVLMRLFDDERIYSCPVEQATEYLEKCTTKKPKVNLGTKLINFVRHLLILEDSLARRKLKLFSLIYDYDFLTVWERWWHDLSSLVLIVQENQRMPKKRRAGRKYKQAINGLRDMHNRLPPEINIDKNVEIINIISEKKNIALYRLICKTLELVPAFTKNSLLRLELLGTWYRLALSQKASCMELLKATYEFLQSNAQASTSYLMFVPLIKPDTSYPNLYCLMDNILEKGKNLDHPKEFYYRCIELLWQCYNINNGEHSEWLLDNLEDLAFEIESNQRIIHHFKTINNIFKPDIDEYYPWGISIKEADYFADEQISFHNLQQLFCSNRFWTGIEYSLIDMEKKLNDAGWADVVKDAIKDRDLYKLSNIARLLGFLKDTTINLNPPTLKTKINVSPWIKMYPPEFQESLVILNGLISKTEHIVDRILGKYFPQPERLKKEIMVLRGKLKNDSNDKWLKTRINNLNHFIEKPRNITKDQKDKALHKIRRAIRKALIQYWQENINQNCLQYFKAKLGINQIPLLFLEENNLKTIMSILKLPKCHRELGIQVLQIRSGTPPWDFDQDPANQEFIAKMRRHGVKMDPWLSASEPIQKEFAGNHIQIAFENDPLEVFRMGAYFQTCLSPGDINFASVLGIFADVNKRVIFARDAKGRVVGRCLFTLSDEGALLTYHPYSHKHTRKFSKLISEFANDLAKQMNTSVDSHGKISKLVAKFWYDDGPEFHCRGTSFMSEDSSFRKSLSEKNFVNAASILQEQLRKTVLNNKLMHRFLNIEELEEHPKLIIPMLPKLAQIKNLDPADWWRIIWLSAKAGQTNFAQRLARKHVWRYIGILRKQGVSHDSMYLHDVMSMLPELDPVLSLKILRMTRSPKVPNILNEPLERRKYIARAYMAQGKAALAKHLLEVNN